jgi:hypothetical protein
MTETKPNTTTLNAQIIPAQPDYRVLYLDNEAMSAHERGDVDADELLEAVLDGGEPVIAWKVNGTKPLIAVTISGEQDYFDLAASGCRLGILCPDGMVFVPHAGKLVDGDLGTSAKHDNASKWLEAELKEARRAA